MKYVIIGNSTAGLSACEEIRKNDKKSLITVISDEKFFAYSRPLLSDYIAGHVKISDDRFHYRRASFYDDYKIERKFGKMAIKLDTKEKEVILEDGTVLRYDRCMIATGGTPFVPPNLINSKVDGVHSFTNLTNVMILENALKSAKKIVVVGAGLIGAKTAEKLSLAGFDVTVVELSKKILGLALDRRASDLVTGEMIKAGVHVITDDSVSEVLGLTKCSGVKLKSGKNIDCDIVIMAIGVKPHSSIAKESGISVNRGIAVDDTMETSAEDVYAAGDVAEIYDLIFQMSHPIPIMPWAAVCGRVAGSNMSAGNRHFAGGFPINSISIGDVSFISMGYSETPDDCDEFVNDKRIDSGIYKKIIIKNGKIKGAIFVGDFERSGMISAMISSDVNVSSFADKLVEDGFWWHSFNRSYREKLTRRA